MLYPEIEQFLAELPIAPPSIDRKEKWDALANKLIHWNKKGAINFICTHNARRSVLSQSLATVFAYKNQLSLIEAWSGGAEETFVHPNTISTLQGIGFQLVEQTGGANPIYTLSYSDDALPLKLFSKKFDDPSSPAPYHAVLVCSKGDAACPFIPNVASRTLIPFEDPGAYDNTDIALSAYNEASKIIGAELRYFFDALCQAKSA